jgi:hypothetical protein
MLTIKNYNKAHFMCALLLITIFSRAQNLVPNPSFEQHTVACSAIKKLNGGGATDWGDAVIGTFPSYFYANSCATSNCCGVPVNSYGDVFHYSHSGNAYAGIYGVIDNGNSTVNLRDYLQAKLLDTLKANHSYYVEFYISLDGLYSSGCNNMGLLIGDTAIASYNGLYAPATPQIQLYGNPAITDTLDWVRVGGVYAAHGGEQYITIGNFSDDAHTDTITINNTQIHNNGTVYFIDDVSVVSMDSMLLYADAGRDTTINKGGWAWLGTRLCGLTNVVWYDSAGAVIATNVPGLSVSPAASTYFVITQTVNGFYSTDTVWVTVLNPLPVSITNYQLRITDGDEVVNSWQTANEVNILNYNVQRSWDGKDFQTIGAVAAKGSGSYTFIDQAPLSAGEGLGVRFYRLQVIDKDGSKSYSKVLSVSLTTDNSPLITVYPNPTKGEVNVKLPSSGNWQIVITDITGRVITQQSCNGYEGSTKLSLAGAKGLYLIKIINTISGQQIVKKITLQ